MGYKEKSIAILLGILEINLVKQKYKNMVKNTEILMEYENFCNEELPKIGEISSIFGFYN